MISERLSRILEGEKVEKAWGNSKKVDFETLVGRRIKRIFSFGKELFVDMGVFLRVHFLMYGSYSVDRLTKDEGKVRLCLDTGKRRVYFYNCSVRILEQSEVEREEALDVLSDKWSPDRIMKRLRDGDELVCDLLLNQEIFPGVGNIIKVEALFRAGVHPLSRVERLPEEKLWQLLHEVRRFSMLFYRCRKAGRRIKPHLLAYNRSTCPRCGGRIVRERTGKRQRLSHFCVNCQRLF